MKDKKSNRKKLKFKNIILLVLALYIGKTFLSQGMLMRDLKNKKTEEEQEIVQLQEEIRGLKEEIKTIDSLDFVEKVAREDLGMLRPKEMVYIDKNKDKNRFMNFRK